VQKSFVVKSPINFANFGFFVKAGDILVHDLSNKLKLTIYRNGEIVKVIPYQSQLGMAAMLNNKFIEAINTMPQSSPKVIPFPAPKNPEPKKEVKPEPKVEVKAAVKPDPKLETKPESKEIKNDK
jgi:hypothetical protein